VFDPHRPYQNFRVSFHLIRCDCSLRVSSRSSIWRTTLRALIIGFGFDMVLMIALVAQVKLPEWLIAAGFYPWRVIFGGPWHGLIWAFSGMAVKGAIYSVIAFVIGISRAPSKTAVTRISVETDSASENYSLNLAVRPVWNCQSQSFASGVGDFLSY